jgi:hypothetical protein
MAEANRGGQLTIENNHLIDIAPGTNDLTSHVTGIHVFNTSRAEIIGNVIQGLGGAAIQNSTRAGIQAINIGSARIDGNQLSDIGPQTDFLHDTAAIDCLGTFERVDVTSNTIRRRLVSPKAPDGSRWFAVRINTLPSTGLTVVRPNLAFAVARALSIRSSVTMWRRCREGKRSSEYKITSWWPTAPCQPLAWSPANRG